eukprot:120319-Pyramimonas_sp.AAC.1
MVSGGGPAILFLRKESATTANPNNPHCGTSLQPRAQGRRMAVRHPHSDTRTQVYHPPALNSRFVS